VANASVKASGIFLAMAKVPPAQRMAVMERELKALSPSYPAEVAREMKRLLDRGKSVDQAAFDAMRVAFANHHVESDLSLIRATQGAEQGWDALVDTALGDISANDRQAGCTAAAAASMTGGVVSMIPVIGTIGGGVLSIGSGIASSALNCGAGTQAAQQQAAQAQAQLAAAQMAQAQAAAMAQQQHQQSMIRAAEIGGGILLAVLAFNWLMD